MKIHVIGNSHVSIFAGSSNIIPYYPHKSIFSTKDKNNEIEIEFNVYHLGPIIAYNFFEHHYSKVLDIIKDHIVDSENEYILIIIGEVDCRWHLPKQASLQNKTNDIIVEECIERFFRSILDLKLKGYKCIGWGGHPSTNTGHNDSESCPVFGNVLERNKITKYFETKLKEKCIDNNIPFISIVDKLINTDGTTKMEYFIDYCHLNHNLVFNDIIQLIKKNILNLNDTIA